MSEVGINISCWDFFRPFRRQHKNIEAERNDELEVTQSGVRDRISDLPDEILCYVVSFLTLRDSVRTRLLAARWRYLCDSRSLLHFDALNVFGRETIITVSQQSKFVRAVNQFIQVWKTRKGWNNVHGVTIHFPLRIQHTSHIDSWIQSFISMGIKDLEFNTYSLVVKKFTRYVFSTRLLDSRGGSNLTCLRLGYCALRLSSEYSTDTSWINQLTTLDLYCVDLRREETECILSNALGLRSLSLFRCLQLSSSINVELPRLQKLVLDEFLKEIVFNCPCLEILECRGPVRYFKFLHVPLLRKLNIRLIFHPDGCSSTFAAVARHAPNLQELSFLVNSQIHPLPANSAISRLKRLDLRLHVPINFDLLAITHFLNACPFLEVLHLKLSGRHYAKQSPQRKYPDRPHYQLKEVKFVEFSATENEMEFARYLIKNAVALERMAINYCLFLERGDRDQITAQLANRKL